jgi:predicted GNAT family N-acyltransferase
MRRCVKRHSCIVKWLVMSKMATPYVIEQLDTTRHERAAFSCGEKSLDNYIKNNARKDVAADVAVCYVLHPRDQDTIIAGYYILNACSVGIEDVAAKVAKTARNYGHIPGMLIGRLAVDQRYQGQKIGIVLLFDALHRVRLVHQQVGIKLVVVDAQHERAANFYSKYGFEPLQDQPLRLYLPVATIAEDL